MSQIRHSLFWKYLLAAANFFLIVTAVAAAFGTFPENTLFFLRKPDHLFGSRFFIFFLAAIALMTLIFSLARFKVLRRPEEPFKFAENPEDSMRAVGAAEFDVSSAAMRNIGEAMEKCLITRGYGIDALSGKQEWGAVKDLWGRQAVPMLHLGFLILAAGGWLTFTGADVREVMLGEGEVTVLPKTKVQVKLEKFVPLLYPDRPQVEEYVSRLLVQEGRSRAAHYELKVNHPLDLSGTRLFQMRYRLEILSLDLSIYRKGSSLGELRLKPGEKKEIPGQPFWIKLEGVIPDFAIDREGNVSSRSPYFRNPAARVLLFEGPEKEGREPILKEWVFPDLFLHREAKVPKDWGFSMRRIKKKYYSGIQLSRDPGARVAYVGFFILVAGAFISSFVIPRKIRIRLKLQPGKDSVFLEVFGAPGKDHAGLLREADVLIKTFKSAVKAPA